MDTSSLANKGEISKPKTLNPAILGVPTSHKIKLSHMTPENKKELMQKLEEWRKAKKEKLSAKILAKQKLIEKSKPPNNFALSKPKSFAPSGGVLKPQDKESVFERLYKGNGKFKKPEVSDTYNKIETQNKKFAIVNPSRPLKVLESNTFPEEISKASVNESVPGESLNDPSDVAELSTNGKIQATFEQPSKPTDSIFKKVPQFSQEKSSNPEPVRNKSMFEKKLDMNKSSGFSEVSCKNLPPKIPLRRSISMLFRQKSKASNIIRKSLSAKNIHELKGDMRVSVVDNEIYSKSEATTKSVTFVTPKPIKFSSTSLKSKLEDWLKMNGHSLEGYRHLRCFEIENSATPLRPDPSAHSNNALENSQVSIPPYTPSEESDKENLTPPAVIPQVDVTQVENWLKELHVLISKMKYPSDRCEEWLTAIRKKYPKCPQLPIYWECRAALNESKGDMKSAIEDYERVIIKGGQVESVGNSLAQLFDKMVIEQKKPSKSKIEKGIDPKNIFKSTIIKFALQQKTLTKLGPQIAPDVREQLYVATPVRRSSRIQSPNKPKEVTSLETLTPDVKKNLTFKMNSFLLEAD